MKKLALSFIFALYGNIIFAQSLDLQAKSVDSLFSKYTTGESSGISVLVVRHGKKIYNRSFGYAEIATKRKATNATNYRIASVTKPFTASYFDASRPGKVKTRG
ncbi:serine hydrolase [Pedobacter sp. SYP-B3415]|uniref:serine hydrolase n=1 Tax=Pedobacter sp. SYP-B3415 TaxID=2496641 RepID=UPI00101C173A|nr:serine hydrolase domain-containing protein [Pedobacter sp. SYP-B3415]